jgi:hypothetical protein
MGGNSFRALQSLATAIYENAGGSASAVPQGGRAKAIVMTIVAGVIPIGAGILVLSLAREGADSVRANAAERSRSVATARTDRGTLATREIDRGVHEPGTVVRRDAEGKAAGIDPVKPIESATRLDGVKSVDARSVDAESALRRAQYEIEAKVQENAALRRELSATRDELGASKSRIGTLAQDLDRKIEESRSRDADIQKSLVLLREAEMSRDREAAQRTEVEGERDRFKSSLADTHLMYAPMTPARIEHRRERLSDRRLAERAGAPLGPVWDGLGDVFVGIAEAVGGPAGEAHYVAILAGGGEVIIDEETARRWERLGVRIEEKVRHSGG